MADRYKAIVIGSGFGGGISACRLSKRWPGKVMVLERGKRYPMGSFPRAPHDFARNFWNLCDVPGERRPRPKEMQNRMDVVLSADLGGGSLIYANVFMEPPEHVFDERWPATTKKAALALGVKQLIQLMSTMKAPGATSFTETSEAMAKFGRFFPGELWDTYVRHVKP